MGWLLIILALLIQALSQPAVWAVVTTSTGLKNAQLDRLFNGGSGTNFDSGKLQIWTGAAPGASTAPSGTKLVELTLNADAWQAAASGSVAKNAAALAANAVASGTMGYWRIVKSGDLGTTNTTDERLEGSLTVTGGGGDMTVQNTSINSGQAFTLSTGTVSHG
jgi:hypothetical protein